MDKNEITRIAREAGFVGMDGDHGALRRFANLVVAAERERIKAANAPEIEAVNAHIKALEDAVAAGDQQYALGYLDGNGAGFREGMEAEREACAKLVEDYLSVGLAKEMSRIIRERGNHAAG
jgi:flagellar biosynthesis/type III secretory pathway protein FliH